MKKSAIEKRKYVLPELKCIQLDNEISLVLDSTPPLGPGETTMNKTPEFMNNDPFNA